MKEREVRGEVHTLRSGRFECSCVTHAHELQDSLSPSPHYPLLLL